MIDKDEIYCPECGTFVGIAYEEEEFDLECGVCGHTFDYIASMFEDEEESEFRDLDFGD